MREQLAQKHIRGSGLEIGALHYPLRVPDGVKVMYVDCGPWEQIKKLHGDVKPAVASWIVDDGEKLSKFEANSQDFIIANHVFEHFENPIYAIRNWASVLNPGGVIYAAIPDKDHTFDRARELTPFSHLVQDYVEGPFRSRIFHYRDWFENAQVEGQGIDVEAKVALAMKEHPNVHFHVWDRASIEEMFKRFKNYAPIADAEFHQNGGEVIVIVKKL